MPENVDGKTIGISHDHTIAGGEVRVFAVRVKENGIAEIPHLTHPPHPKNRVLPLRRLSSIKEEILARPTFFEHFDGVVVDWKYLHDRERTALGREAGWLRSQGLRLYVDLSSGVNLCPGLRLIENVTDDYAASMNAVTNVIDKMELLDARDLLLSLHRHPENNFTSEQTRAAFEKTLKALAAHAASRQVTLHVRLASGKPPWNIAEAIRLLEKVDAKNVRLAASTALLPDPASSKDLAQTLVPKLGLWLVAGRRDDWAGQLWDAHGLIHKTAAPDAIARWIALAPQTPLLFDAVYSDVDEEYLDAVFLEKQAKER